MAQLQCRNNKHLQLHSQLRLIATSTSTVPCSCFKNSLSQHCSKLCYPTAASASPHCPTATTTSTSVSPCYSMAATTSTAASPFHPAAAPASNTSPRYPMCNYSQHLVSLGVTAQSIFWPNHLDHKIFQDYSSINIKESIEF